MKQKHNNFFFLFPIIIIALGFIAYANSLNGKFLYDDLFLIENNAFIKTPSTIINCFTKEILEGAGANVGLKSNFYRPLQTASYALNYAVGKLDVRVYHLTNILLHIAVALCIFWFINILFNNNFLSLVTAVLFIVHPLHTEAVSYISGRADSLAALFMLLSFILYVKLLNENRINILGNIFLLLCYLCALFSKEYSLILPLLLLFYHFVFSKKFRPLEFLSVSIVAVVYLAMRASHLNNILPSVNTDTLWDRLPGVFVAIFAYIKLLFFPVPLHMAYGQKLFGWTDLRAVGGVILFLTILILSYLKRSNKIILFCVGWFFLTLLPMLNLFKINAYMAEHFLYLSSIGFFLLISYFLNLLYNDNKYKIVALILPTCGVLFFLILTIKQNDYWKDSVTFYTKTLEFAPDSANSYLGLGKIYQDQGNLTKALSYYAKVIELNSASAEAYNNRGTIYNSNGNYTEAILDLNKAIELNPSYSQAYSSRGIAYCKKGNYDLSILDLNKSIELNSNDAEAYSNRGNTYNSKGNYPEAILDLNKAIELDPNYSLAYNNRGSAYSNKGNYAQAILDFNKAIELNPNLPDAYNNRGNTYSSKGDYAQAILDFNKAIELNPNLPDAYNNLGNVYSSERNYDQAVLNYTKAIEFKPNYVEAYSNRGIAFWNKGSYAEAILDYNKVIEIDPKYANAYFNRGVAYANKGTFDQAILDYTKTIELAPNLPEAYFNRGTAYNNKGDFDQAILDYNKAIELKSDYLEAYFNRGSTYNNKGNYAQSILDYTTAIEHNPNYAQAYNNRAVVYYNQKDFDKASRDLQKAQELGATVDPKFLDVLKKELQSQTL